MNRKNILLVAGMLTALAAKTEAGELIVNGGFETGDFTGWTIVNQAGGSGNVYNASFNPPLNPSPWGFETVGPAGGSRYAISDSGDPGTHILLQSFSVAPGAVSRLAFEMFVNDLSFLGGIVNPAGLDYTGGANQHVRVDILSSSASAFDTGSGVLANYFLGVDPGGNPHPYTPYSFDISSVVAAGGTYQLRFAEVDNQYWQEMGVDNVSIITSSNVPDTGFAIGYLALGLAGLISFRRLTG